MAKDSFLAKCGCNFLLHSCSAVYYASFDSDGFHDHINIPGHEEMYRGTISCTPVLN